MICVQGFSRQQRAMARTFWQYGHHAALSRYSFRAGSPVVPKVLRNDSGFEGPCSHARQL